MNVVDKIIKWMDFGTTHLYAFIVGYILGMTTIMVLFILDHVGVVGVP